MSISIKMALLLLGLSVLLVASTYSVFRFVIFPSFAELEIEHVKEDMHRSLNAIHGEIGEISNTTQDWSAWDLSYRYLLYRHPAFERENLLPESFTNSNLNLIAYFDPKGEKIWGQMRDLETAESMPCDELWARFATTERQLLRHEDTKSIYEGIITTEHGAMLFVSRPVLTTKHEGPIAGTLIMGRLFTEKMLGELSEQAKIPMKLTQGKLTLSPKAIEYELADNQKCFIEVHDANIELASVVNDIHGQPAVTISFEQPREIAQRGHVAIRTATLICTVGGLFLSLGIGLLLQFELIGPLQHITARVKETELSSASKLELNITRNDELGTLAKEFEAMFARLSDFHEQMVESAHKAGMAEIASEILHNVGNAMNSVSISSELLSERLRQSKTDGLQRAMEMVRQHRSDFANFVQNDPRGGKLLDYLLTISGALVEEHHSNADEISRIVEITKHVREMISTQQTYAVHNEFRQSVLLGEVIDDVLRMHRHQLKNAHIAVDFRAASLPPVESNKSQLMQVITNLVKNAIEAMEETPEERRRLEIVAKVVDEQWVAVDVIDQGHGIAPSNLTKIFQQGFTTKRTGHGIGLHYCANTLSALGGGMSVSSEGLEKGARFAIRLPLKSATAPDAKSVEKKRQLAI